MYQKKNNEKIKWITSILVVAVLLMTMTIPIVGCGSSSTSNNEESAQKSPEPSETVITSEEITPAEETEDISEEIDTASQMSEEARADEIAFIDNLKTEHPDWYEDYITLSKILSCYGQSKSNVEEMFELERSSYDGDDCYRLVDYDSWLGIDGRYILTFLNGKVMSIEFIIGSNAYGDNFDLLLENMEKFLGQSAEVDQSGYDYDYNWTDDFHLASFHMYRYVEGNLSRGGIMFIPNDNYDYSILD